MKLLRAALIIFLFILPIEYLSAKESERVFSFGVVPQQAGKKLRKLWTPFVERISQETGLNLVLKSAPDIGKFQSKMLSGQFDVAYSNPLLYIIANSSIGYQAIAKEKRKLLQSIIVVKKGSGIHSLDDLNGKSMVFPEHAFAATVLVQSQLNHLGIQYNASFVYSHDAAYKFLSLGKYDAAGGVSRTLGALDDVTKASLTVLKKFEGISPHPFSVHPRLPHDTVSKIQASLIGLSEDEEGKKILKQLRLNALGVAKNNDWDDVRAIMSSRK